MGRLKLIKERINMPMPNYLVDDFHWLVEQAEKVEKYKEEMKLLLLHYSRYDEQEIADLLRAIFEVK